MTIVKHGFSIIPDNDLTYMGYVEGVISSVDELANMEITKNPASYTFRITTSTPAYSQMLLQSLLEFHSMLGIKLEVSKSIKNNSTISFAIPLN
jgi:hypothetical protein